MANLYAAGLGSNEYIFGGEQLSENWISLQRDCELFLRQGDVVIAMDANGRTGTISDGRIEERVNEDDAPLDANGYCLLELCNSLGLRIVGEGGFTRDDPAGRKSSTIDYFAVSERLLDRCTLSVHSINNSDYYLSDHRLLKLVIDLQVPMVKRPMRKGAQTSYRKQLELQLAKMTESLQLDKIQLLDQYRGCSPEVVYQGLKKIAKANTPAKAESNSDEGEDISNDNDLLQLRKRYNDAKRRWRRSTDVAMRTMLKISRDKARADFRAMQRKRKAESNSKLRDTYKRLMDIGDIATLRQLVQAPSATDRRLANLPIIETKEQQENMRSHIRQLLQRSAHTPSNAHYQYLQEEYEVELPSDEEISEVIATLKKQSSPGADKISSHMWILFHEVLPEIVNTMIRDVWQDPTKMPAEWNLYNISLLPKSREAQWDPTFVRTLSISQIITKIVSSLITKRLTAFATAQQMIPDEQFGFRSGRSTADAFFYLRSKSWNLISEGKSPIIAFVDLTKAFDKVNRYKLFDKLKQQRVPPDLIHLIERLYRNPTATVNGLGKSHFYIREGVLQGDPLSPLLFAIYLNGLPSAMRAASETVLSLLYADDIALIAGGDEELNKALAELKTFCDDLDIEISIRKTKVLRLGDPNRVQPITIGDAQIEEVKEFTYLGFPIDNWLTNETMVRHTEMRARIDSAKLKRWLTDCRKFVPFGLVKDVVHSIMRGSIAMSLPFLTDKEAKKLDVIEASLWRSVLGLAKKHPSVALWYELGIVPPSIQRKSLQFSITRRHSSYGSNSLISSAVHGDRDMHKSVSWYRSLPEDFDGFVDETRYKDHSRKEYLSGSLGILKEAAAYRGGLFHYDVKAAYLAEWKPNPISRPFWKHDLLFQEISLIWRFRASALGLAHNDPYGNAGTRCCRICQGDHIETEEHLLAICDQTAAFRYEILERMPWMRPRRSETPRAHIIRIGKTRNYKELAKYIGMVLENRKKQLAAKLLVVGGIL